MSCANVQSRSSASQKKLFSKLCANKKDQSLLETSCRAFLSHPTHNPITGKFIRAGKDVHNFFSEICESNSNSNSNSNPTKSSAASTAKNAKSAVAVTNAQIALEEMIELKIETYLTVIDQYYSQRWGKGSKTTTPSPVDWFTQVRNVESFVSLQYDQWVASGNEPVREFVTQHLTPASVTPDAPAAYKTDLYEAAQAFYNHHDLMKIDDLDAIFKAVKDKHLGQLSNYKSVHAERKQRQLFLGHVADLENEFSSIFKADRDPKDPVWVKTEYGGLVQNQKDKRLAQFAERVYNAILELAVQKNTVAHTDLDRAFYVARRRIFS